MMILLYTFALLLLGGARFLLARRASALARKYTQACGAVDQLLREGGGYHYREGNTNRVELCKLAKRTYELGLLTQKRDRLESKLFSWRAWADRLDHWLAALRDWKGQKLPYTLGAVDVWLILYLVDHFGMGEFVSARHLFEWVLSLIA